MPTTRLSFAGHDGALLDARLDLPDGPRLATALFAHCFTCGKDIAAARRISQRLASIGIAVLRFDFTGLGHSEGEFANTDFTSNAGDLVFAARHLDSLGTPPDLLIGHSLGGAAILRAAGDIPSAKAVVTIAAPFDPAHVADNFGSALDRIRQDGRAEVQLGPRAFSITREFIEDIEAANLEPAIKALHKALLILHAPRDEVVGIDNAAQIFTAAKHPKSFVTLDDADHLISDPSDADYVAEVISAWVLRYLPLTAPAPPPGAPEGILRVSEADPNGFMQDINDGPYHHVIVDEPESYGGTNRGMSPYGFLSAGLGACTSMTIRMYARRKGWPLTHVQVDVCHDKVHAQDAADKGEAKADTFRRRIRLEGDLTSEQRAKLMEIADKCPVHRTLERSSSVQTELV